MAFSLCLYYFYTRVHEQLVLWTCKNKPLKTHSFCYKQALAVLIDAATSELPAYQKLQMSGQDGCILSNIFKNCLK